MLELIIENKIPKMRLNNGILTLECNDQKYELSLSDDEFEETKIKRYLR